jgi:hypothetical protein
MKRFNEGIKPAAICSALTAIMLAMLPLTNALAAEGSYEELADLIANNEDNRMSASDLAFLLVTHNFDATPKGDHVEVKIGKSVYNLIPNSIKPGLADIKLQ